MLLMDEDVAPGQRRLVQVPDEHLLLLREAGKAVRIQLHHGRIVNAFEQVLAIGCRGPGRGATWAGAGAGPEQAVAVVTATTMMPIDFVGLNAISLLLCSIGGPG